VSDKARRKSANRLAAEAIGRNKEQDLVAKNTRRAAEVSSWCAADGTEARITTDLQRIPCCSRYWSVVMSRPCHLPRTSSNGRLRLPVQIASSDCQFRLN